MSTAFILNNLPSKKAEKAAEPAILDHDSDEDFGVQNEYGGNASNLNTFGVFASLSRDDRDARAFAESQGYKPKSDDISFDDVYSNNY